MLVKNSIFSKNLTDFRLKKEISQTKMAEILGISRQAYIRYENGEREPSFGMLERIAAFFDVNVGVFFVDVHSDTNEINLNDYKINKMYHLIEIKQKEIESYFSQLESVSLRLAKGKEGSIVNERNNVAYEAVFNLIEKKLAQFKQMIEEYNNNVLKIHEKMVDKLNENLKDKDNNFETLVQEYDRLNRFRDFETFKKIKKT